MLTEPDRSKAADILMTAERERKQATQLSTTWPDITFEDAYAISAEVARRKMEKGAKLIGHKVGLTSKAMQRSSVAESQSHRRTMNRPALDKRDWIAGLEKGLRIIEAFNDIHQRLTPSTAARRTGITRTAARRYLHTLHHLGYLESDGQLFWLTPRVLRLGWSYLDSAKISRAVQPYLGRISAALGGATYFSVLDEDDVVYVARDGSTRLRNIEFVLGAPVAANVSSAGIAMLSCRSSNQVNRWLARRKFVPFTPYTVTTQEGVRELIDSARRKGYALLEQQFERKVRGIAVPIRTHNAEIVGAISVSLPMESETSEQAVARALPLLREAEYSLLALF